MLSKTKNDKYFHANTEWMAGERFDRDGANIHLNNTIMEILTAELPVLKEKIKRMCEEAKRAKYIVYMFSGMLFGTGIFFLMVALSYIFQPSPDGWEDMLATLGFGSASATTFVSVLLLNPVKKIQEANSDTSQAEMVYYAWELSVILYIRAMDVDDRDSIKEAAERIVELTDSCIGMLENYYEMEPE